MAALRLPFTTSFAASASLDPIAVKLSMPRQWWSNTSTASPSSLATVDLIHVSPAELAAELATPRLDEMEPLFRYTTAGSSSLVKSLSSSVAWGRHIIISEDPELHLVWFNSRLFLKPLPLWLMSHDFWSGNIAPSKEDYLPSSSDHDAADRLAAQRAANGFLRSYCALIRHPSDYRIAGDLGIIPESVSWPTLSHFLAEVEQRVTDESVSTRYRYSELRLARLNIYHSVIMRQGAFLNLHGQYGAYFGRFTAPLVFVFGFLSVGLSAMQVGLGAEANEPAWEVINRLYRYLSVISIFLLTAVALIMLLVLFAKWTDEIMTTVKIRRRNRRHAAKA